MMLAPARVRHALRRRDAHAPPRVVAETAPPGIDMDRTSSVAHEFAVVRRGEVEASAELQGVSGQSPGVSPDAFSHAARTIH
jgi:hypothetical protein